MIDAGLLSCNIDYMKESRLISDVLRQAIAERGMSFAALERETGVLRQSLMKFARGEQLRGDAYDKLAAFFQLDLQRIKPKRKGR
jgi:transcriptional regulator with XRE-family HTH domain